MRTATAHLHITEQLLDARKDYEDAIQHALDVGFTEDDVRRILTQPSAGRLADESTWPLLEGPVVSAQEGPQEPAKPKPVQRSRKRAELSAAEDSEGHA